MQQKRRWARVSLKVGNLGGKTLDAVLMIIRESARVALCGSISTYSKDPKHEEDSRVKNYSRLIIKRGTMQGFIYYDHKEGVKAGFEEISKLTKQGKIMDVVFWHNGIEECPNTLVNLLTGGNLGKTIVRVQRQQPQSLATL